MSFWFSEETTMICSFRRCRESPGRVQKTALPSGKIVWYPFFVRRLSLLCSQLGSHLSAQALIGWMILL